MTFRTFHHLTFTCSSLVRWRLHNKWRQSDEAGTRECQTVTNLDFWLAQLFWLAGLVFVHKIDTW